MARRKAATSHTDQHGASERFAPPREYVRGEPSGKRRTSSVLNQTSQILSSAGHALSGNGDEAVVILGALAGAAVGLAIGAAEKRSQTPAQQTEAPHNDPPQSSPTKRTEAPHDDSSQPAPAQLSMEPQQEPALQQIEQPMEQSM